LTFLRSKIVVEEDIKFSQSGDVSRNVDVLEGDGGHFQGDGDGERGPFEDELSDSQRSVFKHKVANFWPLGSNFDS
jgi:hypothetical protein